MKIKYQWTADLDGWTLLNQNVLLPFFNHIPLFNDLIQEKKSVEQKYVRRSLKYHYQSYEFGVWNSNVLADLRKPYQSHSMECRTEVCLHLFNIALPE